MAKVILQPIGKSRESFLPDEIWKHQRGEMQGLIDRLIEERQSVAAGWGEKYRDRVHAKGKMTTWERVEQLKELERFDGVDHLLIRLHGHVEANPFVRQREGEAKSGHLDPSTGPRWRR